MPRLRPLPALVCGLILAAPGVSAAADAKRPANRLAKETSPYLLLHAHNPVDWYPWGPEAFARAKAEKKPIFLSVGYSSCYWCHVMERECFENVAIAKLMNAKFVCVKVDREERPDVDQVYMTALQAFGSGGWPTSMFLTPDGRPFHGGTYFPPEDRDDMPGFGRVLKGIADAWRDEPAEVEKAANQLTEIVRRSLAGSAAKRNVPLSRAPAADCRAALAEQFDPEYGGFGFDPDRPRRPKFPEPANLVFLLDQHRRDRAKKQEEAPESGSPSPLSMVVETMDHMARGGIRDQLAGGYHRYAISRYWIVPHFEKMLYDNAQLATAHLLAFEATGDARWRREAEATFVFIARSMTDPEGGFHSALDAETEGEEGAYYLWTRDEVKKSLGSDDDVNVFSQVYGLKREPNFEKGRYVLLEPRSRAEQALTLKTTPEALEVRLAPLRAKLLEMRDRRRPPLRDEKILTSWNGLTIAAYADGYRLLKNPRYRETAEKTADFLLSKLRTPEGRLSRTYRAGRSKLPAYLEDYAFLAHGLLRLHAATADPKRLAQARELTDRMIADFSDGKEGGFFYTSDDHESLLARPKDAHDGAIPSGNGVAVRNLIALAAATHEARYLDHAGKALEAFSASIARNPTAFPLMIVGLEEYLDARGGKAGLADVNDSPLGEQDVVTATAEAGKVDQGGEMDVAVTLKIKKGWHTYAHVPGVENARPTTLALVADSGAKLVRVNYPSGVSQKLASGPNDKVALYEGEATLTARVQPGKANALKFQIRYQACNDHACLAPATLTVPVSLAADPERGKR